MIALKWIQGRITCRIPDKTSNPELHRLVTKYQMHKCSTYCKRAMKVGEAFVTRCKFGFPRVETDEGKIHKVEDCLKRRNKIYDLPRSFSEMRVNDYNPVLLLLWKANLDIQFISENSLALAQYVMGYVTKAEKSHVHEIWDEISSKESLYSKLWNFGVWSLRSQECGLYEASDILLSDHLCEKSQTVQWIAADQPHKRKRRLRNHNILKELLETDPDSVSILIVILLMISIQHDQLSWRIFVCTISSSVTLTVGLTPRVIEFIESYKSLVFQITTCMILLKKMSERITITPYFYCLSRLGMKLT